MLLVAAAGQFFNPLVHWFLLTIFLLYCYQRAVLRIYWIPDDNNSSNITASIDRLAAAAAATPAMTSQGAIDPDDYETSESPPSSQQRADRSLSNLSKTVPDGDHGDSECRQQEEEEEEFPQTQEPTPLPGDQMEIPDEEAGDISGM